MKHVDAALEAEFAHYTGELAVSPSPEARSVLLTYLDALIEANTRINLTRITDPTAAVRLHLVDSLLALPEVNDAPAGPLLDIGTGGGIPGVPLAVASGRHALLLDSVAKKARAVEAIVEEAGLHDAVEVLSGRAEEVATHYRSAFAVVTARAVAELPALVELAAPFLQPNGRFIALKGTPDDHELERGRFAAKQCGLAEKSVRHAVVPGGDERRTIVTYEKVGEPRVRLPRRVGLAQNSPLA